MLVKAFCFIEQTGLLPWYYFGGSITTTIGVIYMLLDLYNEIYFQWPRNGSGTSRLLIQVQGVHTIFFAMKCYDQKENMGVMVVVYWDVLKGSKKSGSQAYKSEEPFFTPWTVNFRWNRGTWQACWKLNNYSSKQTIFQKSREHSFPW